MKITKKSITLLLAGLLCASNSFSQTYPKQDGVIRLLTYNTHYCKGGTDPGSLNDLNTKRFANILKALDADVVALQELDSAANGRWKRVLLDDIAKWSELDYVQVYGIAADYDGGSVGNGTLVKRWLPIKKIKKMKLSSDVGRILIRTDFEDFSFMSTHLDLDDKHRMNEAAAICTELDYIRKPAVCGRVDRYSYTDVDFIGWKRIEYFRELFVDLRKFRIPRMGLVRGGCEYIGLAHCHAVGLYRGRCCCATV